MTTESEKEAFLFAQYNRARNKLKELDREWFKSITRNEAAAEVSVWWNAILSLKPTDPNTRAGDRHPAQK